MAEPDEDEELELSPFMQARENKEEDNTDPKDVGVHDSDFFNFGDFK